MPHLNPPTLTESEAKAIAPSDRRHRDQDGDLEEHMPRHSADCFQPLDHSL